MELTTLQKQRIEQFVPTFKRYLEATDREADLHERHERTEMLSRLLSAEGLEQMTELEFGQVISSLWASLMWGNKGYLVERLLNDNGLSQLQVSLRDLLSYYKILSRIYIFSTRGVYLDAHKEAQDRHILRFAIH